MLARLQTFYFEHERYITPAAFLLGFIFDNLTLTRIDQLYDNLVLTTYLIIAALGILALNLYDGEKLRGKITTGIVPFLPLIIQFAFGALFSGYFVFYSRSATLAGSWLFILLIAALLIGNERFRGKYRQLSFQLSIFFVALFAYLTFAVPVLIGSIGAWVFVLSGMTSLLIMAGFIYILSHFVPDRIRTVRARIQWMIAVLFIGFNTLYFTNIIPPIPLSLKDIGVYHSVVRTGDTYQVEREKKHWYEFYKQYDNIIEHTAGTPVYVFSSVFSPTGLDTTILHRWQYFDEEQKKWITTDTTPFAVFGGRDEGYRGYSLKSNLFAGKWRVDVITERGQLIGRAMFNIRSVESPPSLIRQEI